MGCGPEDLSETQNVAFFGDTSSGKYKQQILNTVERKNQTEKENKEIRQVAQSDPTAKT